MGRSVSIGAFNILSRATYKSITLLGTIPGVEGDFSSKSGSVFMITPKESDRQTAIVEFKFDNVDLSNGLEWSLGGNTMYYIDSLSLSIEAFDYDEASGNISKRRTLFDFKANKAKGIPDGMTEYNRGHLWVACFGASQV
jgi:sugar lactone lactonase YvrE